MSNKMHVEGKDEKTSAHTKRERIINNFCFVQVTNWLLAIQYVPGFCFCFCPLFIRITYAVLLK